ncbi:MAG: acriflavin resistance protein [Planctomycetes bacterium]|jgi:HAE1 family hydrophobic/amphiphilic exporter-1|nr:acriflavin resistance protein [Planctomycetota bacterium]HJO26651.1 efflux RND transporter permease subunit [Planctomycetota bacterium]
MSSDQPNSSSGGLSFVTRRPVAITMFVLAIAVFGFVSLEKLPVNLLPEITYPTLTVRTEYPGAAPEDVEDRVSERVQDALSTLPGLVRTSSISRAGFSDVLLEFQWGTNMTFAVQDTRDRLDSVFLPAQVGRPLILRYDPNLDPVLRIGVRPAHAQDSADGQTDLVHLRWICENRIQRELESIEGVAAIHLRGGLEEEIQVRVDPARLAALGLSPATLSERLAQENLNAAGGSIREGSTEFLVRTMGEFRSVESIRDLAIVRRNGADLRVRDVATVSRTHARREVVTRLDGREAVEVAVYREAGANIVELADRVRLAIFGPGRPGVEARKSAPGLLDGEPPLAYRLRQEVVLETLSDQSTFIRSAVEDVRQSAIIGALLAVAVIWAFLRRMASTVVIGAAIPISVVVTFAPMYLLGVSINIMSLGGLALGIGMLVDNAIVVLESITRCREEGDDLGPAALRGVREVSGAIVASTLTTVAVFAPIVFVTGIAGQIFGDQAVTVVSSLLVSLLVAILFIPMLASRPWLAGGGAGQAPQDAPAAPSLFADLAWNLTGVLPSLATITGRLLRNGIGLLVAAVALIGGALYKLLGLMVRPLRLCFDGLWRALESIYPRLLRLALGHPLILLAAAAALLVFAGRRVSGLGVELLPEIHQGEFTAHVGLGVGTPIELSDAVFAELEHSVRSEADVGLTALVVGVEKATLTQDIEGEHTARITVRLAQPEKQGDFVDAREREEDLVSRVRGLAERRAEVRSVDIRRPTPFAIEAPIAVEVRGHDLEQLARVAHEVSERLESMEQLTDVRSTVRPGHPEARLVFDRARMLEYDLQISAVADLVRDQVLGTVSTRFVEGDDRIDIRVLGDETQLTSLQDVLELVVNPAAQNPIPLRAVASLETVRGPAEIRRIGNSRAVVITAASLGLDLGGVHHAIEERLADLPIPTGVSMELGGQKRELEEGLTSLRFALILAIFLVYVVMASQFESLLQPFVILCSVPLAGVGVVLLLDLLSIPLSVVVFIGLILLAGIVVNNAIVLVDRINARRRDGLGLEQSIMDAGRARLRPILMTTATTALGLLPLTGWLLRIPGLASLGSGEGLELRAPLAITVIGGLISSTLLTLLVIPALYLLLARLVEGRGRDSRTAAQ